MQGRNFSGIVDSSGLDLLITKKLRETEIGTMMIGHQVAPHLHIIPPRAKDFITYATCSKECIENLGDQELTVFYGLVHMHLIGRYGRLRHIRDGIELPPIIADESYDFNYQTATELKAKTIKAGDEMLVECGYDSSMKSETTYGGEGTNDEMCLMFIWYYPRREKGAENCLSSPEYMEMLTSIGSTVDELIKMGEHTKGVEDDVAIEMFKSYGNKKFTWRHGNKTTEQCIAEYQQFLREKTHSLHCGLKPPPENDLTGQDTSTIKPRKRRKRRMEAKLPEMPMEYIEAIPECDWAAKQTRVQSQKFRMEVSEDGKLVKTTVQNSEIVGNNAKVQRQDAENDEEVEKCAKCLKMSSAFLAVFVSVARFCSM